MPPNRRDFRAERDNDRPMDRRGVGPNHEFHRGERLPMEYRQRHYVVDNWRDHHLSAPPRGYHWVQTGADYVLVAISTGLIVQVFLHGD
jgi:Ni/Co efflux regulator RcnB